MASFKANPAAGSVFLPGHGRVRPGEILMGEEWRKFAPGLLVEVPDPPAEMPMEVRMTPKRVPLEVPKPLEEAPLEMREAPTSTTMRPLMEDKPIEEALKSKPKKLVRRKR
jgi:hypothetical protein